MYISQAQKLPNPSPPLALNALPYLLPRPVQLHYRFPDARRGRFARSLVRSLAWREINRQESYIACCGAGRHTRTRRIHGDAYMSPRWCAANTGKRHFSTPWRNQLIDPHSFRPWPLSFFRPADGAGNFAPRQGDTTPLKNVSRTCVCVWRLGSWMSEWIFEKMLLPLANRSFHGEPW